MSFLRLIGNPKPKKRKAAPCGAAKFREETSKKQDAEASLRCTIYGRETRGARRILQCSMQFRPGETR
jgi:hypothetical protein